MGKQNEVLLATQRDKFVEGAMKKGFTKVEAQVVFDRLESFGSYAFNKSHTVAYAMLSHRRAYLKTHYPHEFMAAMMTGEAGDSTKIARYRSECAKLAAFWG